MSGSLQMPFFTGQPQGMPGQMAAPFGAPQGPTGSVNPMPMGAAAMQPGPYGMPQGQAPNAPPPQVPPQFAQGIGGQQASFLPQFVNPNLNPNLAAFGHFANMPLQPPGAFQTPPASAGGGSPASALAALLASLQAGGQQGGPLIRGVPRAASFEASGAPTAPAMPAAAAPAAPAAPAPAAAPAAAPDQSAAVGPPPDWNGNGYGSGGAQDTGGVG